MITKTIIRWLATFTFVLFFAPIGALNVERLAERKGWDSLLLSRWDGGISVMLDFAESGAFVFLAGISLGAAATLWIDYLYRKYSAKIKIIRPNIPTSIRMQFTAGSHQARQLSTMNIASAHFERQQFRFSGEDGSQFQDIILWVGVLIFEKPTTYGQIVVDAGNAVIPEYTVTAHRHDMAIIRFAGDIGNVAIEVKCIPPNPIGA